MFLCKRFIFKTMCLLSHISNYLHHTQPKNEDSSATVRFMEAAQKFQNELLKTILDRLEIKSNEVGKETMTFVISPLWLEYVLILISTGTTDETLIEMNKVMQFSSSVQEKIEIIDSINNNLPKTPHLTLEIKNILFIRDNIRLQRAFETNLKSSKVKIKTFDREFDIPLYEMLNAEVNKLTGKKMKDVFRKNDLINVNDSFIYFTSVYYKNKWLYSPILLDQKRNFSVLSGENVELRMFKMVGLMNFADIVEWDVKIIDIPYESDNISMLVFLPNKQDGLKVLEKKITMQKNVLHFIYKRMNKKIVSITLPSYSLETAIFLRNKLKAMGMKKIFSDKASLARMVFNNENYSFHIIQRTKLWADAGSNAIQEVDDEAVKEYEIHEKLKYIKVDHPFFFILKNKHLVYLMGHFSI